MKDDTERIQWYILHRLDDDEWRKYRLIDDIEDDRSDDWIVIKDAFEQLDAQSYIEQTGGEHSPYTLTEKGEARLLINGSSGFLAVDFVGVQHKDDLDEYLKEALGVPDPPDVSTKSGVSFEGEIGPLTINNQDWGSVDTQITEFESLSVQVFFYTEVPLGYYLILYGEIDTEYYTQIFKENSEASFPGARSAIRDVWNDLFGDLSIGLVTGYPDSIELVGQHVPVTIATINIDMTLNDAIAGNRTPARPIRGPHGPGNTVPLTDDLLRRYYTRHFGRRGIFEALDLEPNSDKSLIREAANGLCVIGKSKGMNPGNKTYHSNYTIVEISTNLGMGVRNTPPSALRVCDDYIERLLPLLYIFNWYKATNRNFWEMNESIREMELIGIDTSGGIDEVQKDMQELLKGELEFSALLKPLLTNMTRE